jgi:cyclopropane-fatty-acyl-phospholipid synthase
MSKKSHKIFTELFTQAGIPINGPEPYSIQIHDERIWDRLLDQRLLGLAEGYVDGWWSCERVDEMLTRFTNIDLAKQIPMSPGIAIAAAWSRIANRQNRSRSPKNAEFHYGIGNDLFELMLDDYMMYSCGYWQKAKNLNDAQIAKMDLICKKLKLKPGMRVLDIGCGWGGFLEYAAKTYGVTGVGITPVDKQILTAKKRCDSLGVEIHKLTYQDLDGRFGKFDRIVSIGMMEHVGPKNLKLFFNKCDEQLVDDGIMLHHLIGSTRARHDADPFYDRYIFPGGILPSVSQFAAAAEPNWVIEDVHNFGMDYAKTLAEWHKNVTSNWEKLDNYDERFRKMWEFYLLACIGGFMSRKFNLWQYVMRRKGMDFERYTCR